MPTSCKLPKPSPPHGTHPLPLGGSHGEKITFTDSDVSDDDDFTVSTDMSACELVYALTDIHYAYLRYENAVDTLLELWALTVTASCGTHNGFSMRYLGERVEKDVLTVTSTDRQVRAWLRDYFNARKDFCDTFADLFHFARSRELPEEEYGLVEDLTSITLQVSNFLSHWALGCHVLKECELLDMPELSGHWRYHLVNLLKLKGFSRRVNTDIPFMYKVSDDFKKGMRERSLAGLNTIFAPVNGEPATEEIARRVGVPTSSATILPNGMALDTLHLNADVWSVVLSYA